VKRSQVALATIGVTCQASAAGLAISASEVGHHHYACRMATFVLVHGAFHGAWCWESLAPLLRQAGHEVVAMDLPIEDGSASFEDYADVVCASLDGYGDDVVVVGHSFGGLTIPLVAARRPVRHLVYLCAVVPEVGKSVYGQLADEPEMADLGYHAGCTEPDAQLRMRFVDLALFREWACADCDDTVVQTAFGQLRPQSMYSATLPFSLAQFPSVPCTSVICSEDRVLGREWAERIARDRLGAELVELPGSHSPFLSRPAAVADVLLRVAGK
jgi:pimeloyl-ACP methyl ester carboxylesterase